MSDYKESKVLKPAKKKRKVDNATTTTNNVNDVNNDVKVSYATNNASDSNYYPFIHCVYNTEAVKRNINIEFT